MDNISKWVGIGVGILIVLSLVAALYPEMEETGELLDDYGTELTDATRCGEVGCFWNATRATDCTKTSVGAGDTTVCSNTYPELPFGSMFSAGGIAFMIFAVGLLITIIFLVMKKK